jgi:hypothetical protein
MDHTLVHPLTLQADSPQSSEFLPVAACNRRLIKSAGDRSYAVSDLSVAPRGSRHLLWSSQGGIQEDGTAIVALSSDQQKAAGTTQIPLDLSASTTIVIMICVTDLKVSSKGEGLSFGFSLLDGSADFPVWTSAVQKDIGSFYVAIGQGVQPLADSSAATPTGLGAITHPSGWSVTMLPFPLSCLGRFFWTASGVLATSWTVSVYGSYE